MPCSAAMYRCPLNRFRDSNEKNYFIFKEVFPHITSMAQQIIAQGAQRQELICPIQIV